MGNNTKIYKNEFLWLILIPLLTSLIFFSKQLFGDYYFWTGYWSDVTELVVPFFNFSAEAVGKGELPFWNPYSYGGNPHISENVVGFFYPFHFIGYFLVKNGMSSFTWIMFTLVFHFWLIQVSIATLLRKNKFGLFAALFAAIAFTFSSKIVYSHNYVSFIINIAWIPFTFLFLQKLLEKSNYKWAILMSLSFAMSFLGGNPNVVFFSILMYFIYFIIWFIFSIKEKKELKFYTKKIPPFIIAMVLILVLTMPQLIETLSFLPYTPRAEISFDFASDGSLKWNQLATIFSPKIFGYYMESDPSSYPFWDAETGGRAMVYHYWETSFYFGILTLFLAIIGLLNHYKNKLAILAVSLAIFGLLYALGKNSFLYEFLFNYIPGFDNFRIPGRAMIISIFGIIILSAFGVKTLMENKVKKKNIFIPIAITLVIFFLAAQLIDSPSKVEAKKIAALMNNSYRIILVSIIIILLRLFNVIKNKNVFGALILLIIFADLYQSNEAYKNSKTDPEKIYLVDTKPYKALYPDTSKDFFRVSPKTTKIRLFKRNQATFLGLYSTDGLYSLRKKYDVPKGGLNKNLRSVKYIIAHQTNSSGQFNGRFGLEENKDYLPYARMVYKAKVYDTLPEKAENLDYKNAVQLLSALENQLPNKDINEVNNSISYENYSLNNRKFKVNTSENGVFVLSEFYYPAWKVSVDGERKELLKTNFFQQGVELAKGEHIIEFQYENKYFWLSFYLYLIAFVCIGIYIVYLLFRKKMNVNEVHPTT